MEETWESLFKKKSIEQGHSPEFIKVCLEYGLALKSKNLPIIFNKEHLARFLCVSMERLFLIANTHQNCYNSYSIRKKNSRKRRYIDAPFHDLKEMQRIIYKKILQPSAIISSSAHGFIPKDGDDIRSIYTNALPHEGCSWMLNMDMKDFFPSITYDTVREYFGSLGFTEEVGRYLTEVCTFNKCLPQGAPTSPILSNVIAHDLDLRLEKLAKEKKCTYTRYADDITFSGQDKDNAVTPEQISAIIEGSGFRVNKNKTKSKHRGQKMSVTGLTITHGVHVPKSYRKDVWMELHCCQRFGIEEHVKHIGNIRFYKQWLLGRIMYVRSIDKECGDKMLNSYNSLNWI